MDYQTEIETLAARGAQFTICPQGQVSINGGVVVIDHLAAPDTTRDYKAKPVHVEVQPDLTLTLAGERFAVSVKLMPADALALVQTIGMFARDAAK